MPSRTVPQYSLLSPKRGTTKQNKKQDNLANANEFGILLLGHHSGLFLVLLPAAGEDIIESFLEGTAIHIDKALFILRLGVPDNGNKTKIPTIC